MNAVLRWASREPLRAMALAQAILAAAAPFIPSGLTTALLGILAAILGVGTRQIVTPVAVAAENTARAVAGAANQVARDLDGTTAGLAGTVTVTAENIVDRAITDALKGAA